MIGQWGLRATCPWPVIDRDRRVVECGASIVLAIEGAPGQTRRELRRLYHLHLQHAHGMPADVLAVSRR